MRLSDNDGFTLIELMIALVISGIISIAMYSAYTSQQRVNQAQDHVVAIQQDLRAGLDMMARELRMAGYDPDKKWGAGFVPSSMNGTVNSNTVAFTLVADDDQVDNNKDGTTDEAGELKAVQYDFAPGYEDTDGINDIRRQVGYVEAGQVVWSGNPTVLIENVDRVEFLYTLVDGSQPVPPAQTDLTGDKIRSIQISVLVRASEKSVGYLDTESYQSASGADWTPPHDDMQHFRRRMQVITVDCRNMGW
jgi:type IV pilus assembly protein PilW